MYFLIVAALMFFFPIASILIEVLAHHVMLTALLMGKWFAFWAVGVRLLLAGVRQIVQPSYTAEVILGIKNTDAALVVRELGFANLALSVAGIGSVFFPAWILPATLAGTVFYGSAGINHMRHKERNRHQHFAMLSDLFVAIVLLYCCSGIGTRN